MVTSESMYLPILKKFDIMELKVITKSDGTRGFKE
jgi:hypothetical protein